MRKIHLIVRAHEMFTVTLVIPQVLKTFSQSPVLGKNWTKLRKEKETEDRKNNLIIAVNHEHGLKASASLHGREVMEEQIIECCKILTVMKKVHGELLFLFSSYTTTRSHQKKENQIRLQTENKQKKLLLHMVDS